MPCHHPMNEPVECINCGKVQCEDALCKHDRDLCAEEYYDDEGYEDGEDDRTAFDMSDDGDALASAGWGTDEQYGYYGGED